MGIPLIEGLRKKYGSLNAASRATGMPAATLHRFGSGERDNPTLDTMEQLASACDVPLEEVIRQFRED